LVLKSVDINSFSILGDVLLGVGASSFSVISAVLPTVRKTSLFGSLSICLDSLFVIIAVLSTGRAVADLAIWT
jgi:hypothetical protein